MLVHSLNLGLDLPSASRDFAASGRGDAYGPETRGICPRISGTCTEGLPA